MTNRKYARPEFLKGQCSEEVYRKWLDRKARAHVRRDRGRKNDSATRKSYMERIHKAVLKSHGRDAYTGGPLDWTLISTYDNAASKREGLQYKR